MLSGHVPPVMHTVSYAPSPAYRLVSEKGDGQMSNQPNTATPRNVDERTITAFRSGDVDALGAIFDAFGRAVWSVAFRVLGDRQLAEDATQETFLRAWKAAHTFEPGRAVAPWLLTIARRTALDVFRKESRPTRGDHAPERDVPVEQPGMVEAWESWEIRLALDQLSDEERQVVRLSHFEGLTHDEIARQVDVPIGTVKSRSHRAHRRLAGLLAHLPGSGGVL